MAGEMQAPALPEVRVSAGWTLGGLAAGLAAGLLAGATPIAQPALAVIAPVGALWLQGLQMTILPLVASLLMIGIVRTVAAAEAGPMARRTLILFITILLAFAAMSAVLTPLILQLVPVPQAAGAALRAGLGATGELPALPGLGDFIRSLVPANVFAAAAGGSTLPVIVFFALFAVATTRLPAPQGALLAQWFAAVAGAMIVVIGWVLRLAPIGVFALAFAITLEVGAAALGALVHYILVVSAMGGIVLLSGYVLGIVGGRRTPAAFARALLPAQAVAISTQSSLASVPAMLAGCRMLGLRESSAEFVLPLAVALFRATGPAMNIAVGIYLGTLLGVPMPIEAIVAAVLISPLVSIGSPSLPNAISFISSMAPIAAALGVPIAPLALLLAVEVLPDIVRTVGNVTMDVAVTAAVDRRARDQSPLP